ncbi:MAG: hypothetical protein HGB14_07780 [Anaerolineaceae bacterium]|nr:hypothetical protein [Anaerolineaceae bacterium]
MLPLIKVRIRSYGMIGLVLVAPLLYYASIVSFSTNVPVGDDYNMLGFFNEFTDAGGIGSKLNLLFSFHNEHRIVITRSIMLLWSAVAGSVDFRALNWIGNLALLPALIVLGRMIGPRGDRLTWALLFLIVMQPQLIILMFYPMAVISAFFGLLFSFLYLRNSLHDSKWYLVLLFYLLASFTTGAGIFLILLGAPILLYQRRYAIAIVHVVASIVVILWYSPSSADSAYFIQHPLVVIEFFLLLLGSAAQLPKFSSYYMQIGFSFILIGYFVFFLKRFFRPASQRIDIEKLTVLCSLLYLLMMIGLIAIGRASNYESDLLGASLNGRYRIYSLIFFAVCCIDFVRLCRELDRSFAPIPVLMVILALVFNLSWYSYSLKDMRLVSFWRVYGMKHWLITHDVSMLPMGAVPPEYVERNLTAAVNSGIFKP